MTHLIYSMAQYYVDLLKLIVKEGSMSVLNDEQERLLLIMESVGRYLNSITFQFYIALLKYSGSYSF